ncbi:RNA polymerase sigma factor [Neobacillus sp. GCM10023253]|uniref:RNA polymerase sigma factor n=1 Tax=Neobacillus sp. GCM10023253 TaxID=3252644 RepID=UPI00361C4BDF
MELDFTELYSLYYKRLFVISYSITRDRFHAEDVVQETFIKALNKAGTIEEQGKMGAWLSVIAARTAIDFIRREKRKKAVPFEHDLLELMGKETKQNVEQEVETGLLFEEINEAIGTLQYEQQELLMLKFTKGLKEEEIANVLQLNPNTVKTKIYRARKKLKLLVFETKIA